MRALPVDKDALAAFCVKWKVQELALFGSYLHGRERQGSDLDLLVTFAPDAEWSLFDHMNMEDELARLAGRPVDLVSRKAIERSANPLRRAHILGQAETVYVAA